MKTIPIYFAYCEGHDEEIAYGLNEEKTREIALESFWVDELGGDITVSPIKTSVHEVDGILDYTGPEETNHINWQCPLCKSWASEDYNEGDISPTLVLCDNYRKHAEGKDAWILTNWNIPKQ